MVFIDSETIFSNKDSTQGSCCTLVSGALRDPWPSCQFKFRPDNVYHVKEHKKLRQITSEKVTYDFRPLLNLPTNSGNVYECKEKHMTPLSIHLFLPLNISWS